MISMKGGADGLFGWRKSTKRGREQGLRMARTFTIILPSLFFIPPGTEGLGACAAPVNRLGCFSVQSVFGRASDTLRLEADVARRLIVTGGGKYE